MVLMKVVSMMDLILDGGMSKSIHLHIVPMSSSGALWRGSKKGVCPRGSFPLIHKMSGQRRARH
jgi:hypothetical protein